MFPKKNWPARVSQGYGKIFFILLALFFYLPFSKNG
jgi:hypothetical protein